MKLIYCSLLALLCCCGDISAKEVATHFAPPLDTIQIPDEWNLVYDCYGQTHEDGTPRKVGTLVFKMDNEEDVDFALFQVPLRDRTASLDIYEQEMLDYFAGSINYVPTLIYDDQALEINQEEWKNRPELISIQRVYLQDREWIRLTITNSDTANQTKKCNYTTLMNGNAYVCIFSASPECFEELNPIFDAIMMELK